MLIFYFYSNWILRITQLFRASFTPSAVIRKCQRLAVFRTFCRRWLFSILMTIAMWSSKTTRAWLPRAALVDEWIIITKTSKRHTHTRNRNEHPKPTISRPHSLSHFFHLYRPQTTFPFHLQNPVIFFPFIFQVNNNHHKSQTSYRILRGFNSPPSAWPAGQSLHTKKKASLFFYFHTLLNLSGRWLQLFILSPPLACSCILLSLFVDVLILRSLPNLRQLINLGSSYENDWWRQSTNRQGLRERNVIGKKKKKKQEKKNY